MKLYGNYGISRFIDWIVVFTNITVHLYIVLQFSRLKLIIWSNRYIITLYPKIYDFVLMFYIKDIIFPYFRYLEEPAMIAAFNGKQTGKHVVQIACGSTYSAAITADGELYTWGRGNYGRLGHGMLRLHWTAGHSLSLNENFFVCSVIEKELSSDRVSRLQWGPDHTNAGDGAEGAKGDGCGMWKRWCTNTFCDREW